MEGEPRRKEDCAFARLVYDAGTDAKEGCPYPWAISPEKWLQDDMYLNLAVVFLVLRLVYLLVPALVLRLKVRWEEGNRLRANHPVASNEVAASLLGNASQVGHEAALKQLAAAAAAASSSSDPAVAESRSSRAGPSDEVHAVGAARMY